MKEIRQVAAYFDAISPTKRALPIKKPSLNRMSKVKYETFKVDKLAE